jgi:hypothetical protein
MIYRSDRKQFKLQTISIPGEPPFECYVIQQTATKRTVLKPTDKTLDFFHLILIDTPRKGPVSYWPILGPISTLELWQYFL